MLVKCKNCGRESDVSPSAAGMTYRCPSCGRQVTFPGVALEVPRKATVTIVETISAPQADDPIPSTQEEIVPPEQSQAQIVAIFVAGMMVCASTALGMIYVMNTLFPSHETNAETYISEQSTPTSAALATNYDADPKLNTTTVASEPSYVEPPQVSQVQQIATEPTQVSMADVDRMLNIESYISSLRKENDYLSHLVAQKEILRNAAQGPFDDGQRRNQAIYEKTAPIDMDRREWLDKLASHQLLPLWWFNWPYDDEHPWSRAMQCQMMFFQRLKALEQTDLDSLKVFTNDAATPTSDYIKAVVRIRQEVAAVQWDWTKLPTDDLGLAVDAHLRAARSAASGHVMFQEVEAARPYVAKILGDVLPARNPQTD